MHEQTNGTMCIQEFMSVREAFKKKTEGGGLEQVDVTKKNHC